MFKKNHSLSELIKLMKLVSILIKMMEKKLDYVLLAAIMLKKQSMNGITILICSKHNAMKSAQFSSLKMIAKLKKNLTKN